MIDIDFYNENGYCVIRNVVPEDAFDYAWQAIDPWIDACILDWFSSGLISHQYSDLSRWERLNSAWVDARKPHFRRQPLKNLTNIFMYKLMKSKFALDIAEELLGTAEISVHGIYNVRPQLSSYDPVHLTPIHQDSQYWFKEPNETDISGKKHVVTFWMPLRDVDVDSGCLSVISKKQTKGVYYEPYDIDYDRSGMIGLSPDALKGLTKIPIPMNKGDILVFNQLCPHGANYYEDKPLRWAVDFRYEATNNPTLVGLKYGFIAQNKADPSTEDGFEHWEKKRELYLDFIVKKQ